MNSKELKIQYDTYQNSAVIIDVSRWTQIELTGTDRVKFLHNMSTGDINALAVGSGCEAFLLNAQGKILAFITVLCKKESLLIGCNNDQTQVIIEHLDRYLITEDVTIIDHGNEWGQLLLTGPSAAMMIQQLDDQPPPTTRFSHEEVTIDARKVTVHKSEGFGPNSFFLQTLSSEIELIEASLITAGAIACEDQLLEILRVESGEPVYGVDITVENLPQEIARNQLAISFTKGCYLGQETVARIDALGHVNRYLVGLEFTDTSELPPVGCELTINDKKIGKVTSSVYSYNLQSPLALGYVRRGHHTTGTEIESTAGKCMVIEIPIQSE